MLAAVACVVAGGPLFADGLRALRLRRLLAGLAPSVPHASTEGFVHLTGHVALESPLFSPLSMRPCAGFQLEVRAGDATIGGRMGQYRGFRLVHPSADAFVEGAPGVWRLPVTAEREVKAGEAVSANLAALLDHDVTLRWLRARKAPMHIVERSLEAGARVEVMGFARSAHAHAVQEPQWLALTGTDGGPHAAAPAPPADRPRLRIGSHDPLDLQVVGEGGPGADALAPPRWRALGALLGPALSLAGLVYLAHAVEATMGARF